MIQRYLVPYATELDERRYRVVLRDRLDFQANQEFHESGVLAAPWLEEIYRGVFRSKLQVAGFNPPPGARVLDACCGFGYLGRFIAEELGAKIVFCDLSWHQLADMRERVPTSTGRRASCADVTRLPYEDAAFDAVVGNSFLHHLPDVPSALEEFRRVLKPGGVFILLHEPGTSANFWESFPLSLLKDASPVTGFTDLWMFDRKELERLVVEAGFSGATVNGTGILSGIVLNWLLILALKLDWHSRFPMYAAYALRTWMNKVEAKLPSWLKGSKPPSLMLIARKAV
jgi:SAM-dependent methyltransferase